MFIKETGLWPGYMALQSRRSWMLFIVITVRTSSPKSGNKLRKNETE
jgi:hypothetical protein